jgi:hypothetical protein
VIENDLTRIANALETIAQALIWKNEFMVANHQTALTVDGVQKMDVIELKKTAEFVDSLPFPEPVKETPVLHDTIGTGKTVEVEAAPEPAPVELKFEEVSKEFFALLNRIKETKGLEEAKQVATDLIRQYNNGKPISLATLPKEAYAPLFEKITQAKVQYEPA